MEPGNGTKMQPQNYRYSISHLAEIGCRTNIAVDISLFNSEAIQAGIVTGPSLISKPLTMPLGEKSTNRDRGWSMDSLDSTEERVVYAGSKANAIHPRRQPRNAPSDDRAQVDEGFARFLQQHSSPTHRRVTAGGRIVPMGPTLAAPPEFNMPTDNLARANDNNNHTVREMADAAKIGKERPVFPLPMNNNTVFPLPMNNNTRGTTANSNAENLAARSRGNRRNAYSSSQSYSSYEQIGYTDQDNHVTTKAEGLKKGNPLPRPSDLPHVTSSASTTAGLSQRSVNVTSSFNPNHQTLGRTPWDSLSLAMPTMVFDPYTNMLVTNEEYNPIMPTPIMPAAPNSTLSATDQMAYPADLVDNSRYTSQQDFHPAMWPTYQPVMPLNSTAYHQLPYPDSASMINHSGMSSMASAQGGFTPQIGTQSQANSQDQMSAINTSFKAGFAPQIGTQSQASSHAQMSAVNTSFNSMSMNDASTQHITEEKVMFAEMDYNRIDSRLRNHDQYSARNFSTFTAEVKNIHAKERLRLAEERNKARCHWLELQNLLGAGRSVQHFVPTLSTNHQQTSSIQGSIQGGNRNFNVQASAWTPNEMNQSNGGAMHPQSADPYAARSSSTMHNSGHPSSTMRLNSYTANPLSNELNMQLAVSSPSVATPGPYPQQLNNLNHGVMLDRGIDNWGISNSQAPPELAKKQSEQDLKLAKIHPEIRGKVSYEEFDRTPLRSNNVNSRKRVSFAENETDTTYRIAYDGDDGASDATSYDESTWTPMLLDEDDRPEPREWAAIKAASNKEYGVETRIFTTKGKLITIKGGRPPGLFFTTATSTQNNGIHTYQSVRSDQRRNAMTNQMMGMEGNARRPENVRAPQGGHAFPGGRGSQVGRPFEGGRGSQGPRGLEGLGYRGIHAFEGRRGFEGARGFESRRASRRGRAFEGGRGSEGGRGFEEDVGSVDGDITPKASSSVLSAWAKTDENNFRRNKGQSSVAIQNVTAPGTMPGFEGATARFGGLR